MSFGLWEGWEREGVVEGTFVFSVKKIFFSSELLFFSKKIKENGKFY